MFFIIGLVVVFGAVLAGYFMEGGKIHVLHVFTKKTQKTPKSDIDLAKVRYKEAKNG